MRRSTAQSSVRWLASLFVLVCSCAVVLATALDPRGHVLPRDYDNREYYVAELNWLETEISCDDECRARRYADKMGLRFEEQVGSLTGHYLFSVAKMVDAADSGILHKIKARDADPAEVRYVEKMKTKKLYKRGIELEPRAKKVDKTQDIMDTLDIKDPLFSKQWHLYNPVQRGNDINVTGVWLQNVTGTGVVTAIVDDGLDFESDDLRDNFFAKGSYDFNDPGPLPKPRLADDHHGTRCAGEIAAVKNKVCGVGAAYTSKVAGIRILSKEISDVDEALSLNYGMQDNHIYSCSWGPPDDGRAMDAPGILIKRAFVNGVENGRSGLGSIFVFASGNGAKNGDNCNFDGYTNSIYSITVGAVDRMGLHPYYAEDCSAQLVVTSSSGSNDYVHTTDVGKNKCADNHGGTSAAAPLAAGIFALVLSVRPDLTWRDMQYLAIGTAVPVENADAGMQDTAMKRKFSHRYGFGKLDAYAIVEAAKTWELVKPQAWFDSEVVHVHQPVPHGAEGLSSTITVVESDVTTANLQRLEHVQVTVTIHHQRRGDVSVMLTSPSGVHSYLATNRPFDDSTAGMNDWTFMSVAHWGESGVGNWTLTVFDTERPELSGSLETWKLKLWGESIDAALAKPYPIPEESSSVPAPTSTAAPTSTVAPVTSSTLVATSINAEPTPTTSTSAPVAAPTWVPGDEDTDDSGDYTHDEPYFSFLPSWDMSSGKVVWLYGAGMLIVGFVALMIVYILVQRRKTAATHATGESIPFQRLMSAVDIEREAGANNSRRTTRRTGDLYDAFENIDDEDPFAVEDDVLSEPRENVYEDDAHGISEEPAGSRTGTSTPRNGGRNDEEDRQRLLGTAK
ncbi:peptidase S8/S53 domain-containing protein [Lipomyces arxii]|uniref:peptidase S8/S53 domain-containing protein n=1 Tax=Lipomyces arxii TaxID=56418 RepID=UPI0034CD251C